MNGIVTFSNGKKMPDMSHPKTIGVTPNRDYIKLLQDNTREFTPLTNEKIMMDILQASAELPIAADEFVNRWQMLSKDNTFVTIDGEGEQINIWFLNGRVLKYKKLIFDNCAITTRMLVKGDQVECKVGLIYDMSKPNDVSTTHWRTISLDSAEYNNPAVTFAKIVLAAANLTLQGKLEADVCTSLLKLIHSTLGHQYKPAAY